MRLLCAMFLVIASAMVAPAVDAQTASWQVLTSAEVQLDSPMSIAVDADGHIYVADTGHNRVVQLSADSAMLTSWSGESIGGLAQPQGVATGPDSTVWVSDTGNDRIVRLAASGAVLTQFGEPGTGSGQFRDPNGLAVDEQGNVFVADTLNHRIQKLAADGSPLAAWGNVEGGPHQDAYETSRGRGIGEFRYPTGLALDDHGYLLVADTDNFRVVRLLASSGEYVDQWIDLCGVTRIKHAPGSFLSPRGVAVGPVGSVYVADTFTHWIQRMSTSGEPLASGASN